MARALVLFALTLSSVVSQCTTCIDAQDPTSPCASFPARMGPCPYARGSAHVCYTVTSVPGQYGQFVPAGTPYVGWVGVANSACGRNGQFSARQDYNGYAPDTCFCCSGWAGGDGRCNSFAARGAPCLTDDSCVETGVCCLPDQHNNWTCQFTGSTCPLTPRTPHAQS